MFEHSINPVFLSIGPIEIRWYGIMWAVAFLFVYWYVRRAARKGLVMLSDDDVDWLMVWLIVGVILGARLFEVFVWEPGYYFANPAEIIAIWHGGLSFHGGLVGGLVAGYFFARRKKVGFLRLCDICIVPIALGQVFGRIGNFINGELWGRITSVPWAVKFPGAEGFRHPSQLYEALYDLVIFLVLLPLAGRKHHDGFIFGLFLVLYSIFRFVTEFFREPTAYVLGLTLGQALCIPMLVFGIWLLFYSKKLK
ncbi:MAG: prolipoprotein diacylglyceryl transferase [Candidatus Woesearchaeota archaeon]